MKLLIVLITFNRLKYSKRTLRDLFATIETPYYLVAVDNSSDDGTQDWLTSLQKRGKLDKVILNPENYYPGKACNIGWEEGLKEYPNATHLMRLDNDMHLEKGWDKAAAEYFEAMPSLGQLGIEHEAIENPRAAGHEITIKGKTINRFPGNVGGPCIISRAVWDMGLRYPEGKWYAEAKNIPTAQEDVKLSRLIEQNGFIMGHMDEKLAWTFANRSNWGDFPEYYTKTLSERGYDRLLEEQEWFNNKESNENN